MNEPCAECGEVMNQRFEFVTEFADDSTVAAPQLVVPYCPNCGYEALPPQ